MHLSVVIQQKMYVGPNFRKHNSFYSKLEQQIYHGSLNYGEKAHNL